jgi:hypothetical protein
VLAEREDTVVEDAALVDRFAAAAAADLQHVTHRTRPRDQIIELRQLQQGEMAKAFVGELVAGPDQVGDLLEREPDAPPAAPFDFNPA